MIKIDYGDKEALLFSLYDKAEALNSSTSADMFSFDFLSEKYEITHEQKQIADQIIAIEKEAVANALKYYSTRLDELADDLKGDIELRIILGQHTLTDFAELTPFLDLLAEKNPELHKQIIHFTVETFRNKDNLMKTPYAQLVMKKLQEHTAEPDTRPVIKATTHVVKSLAFEVTKAGRDLRDKNQIADFYEYECSITTRKSNAKKKTKPVDTVITLDFKAIEEWESYLLANKQITRMDIIRAIHASALFAAGNHVVSSDMILRQMNGGKDLQTTPAQRKEIQDSFARLGQTWITIDASQEVKSGLNTKRKFKGALLPCGMIIGNVILNGQPAHDCIRIYDTSPLIKYAIAKGQASPIHIDMFNIPGLNATDENTELIDYLIRIYASAVNKYSHVKPVILYDKIYEYLGVDGSNQQVIYNKKAKIRKAVRKIFTAWEGRFIKDFHELTADNNPVKAGTKAVKVILDLYTLKEFNKIHKNELEAV